MEIAETNLARPGETIRSFIGIGIPDRQRRRLAEYLEACRATAPELRWIAAGNLHLTLRFLGSVDSAKLESLAMALRQVPVGRFEVGLGGLGSFGRGSAVRVVWLGVTTGREGLQQLAAAVEERCGEVGLRPEERPFNPHLTLARARQRRGARVPELPAPPALATWPVDRFSHYRSRPGPGGAVYTVLEEFGG